MDRSTQQLPSFCNDIILEILSWLSVDSLLRFKSVSKSWFSLITHPKFAKLHIDHHHHSLTATQIHNPTIMFTSETHYSLKSMDKVMVSSSSSTVVEKMELVYPFHSTHHLFHIVGTCNGLICIIIKFNTINFRRPITKLILCLWNPSTKDFKQLPSHEDDDAPPFEFPPYHGNGISEVSKVANYGFGYDHVMEDYKVIASVQWFREVDDMYHYELKVYTLGTDSWRRIPGSPYKREHKYGCYRRTNWSHVNGVLYRIAKLSSSSDIRILSFDIVEEVYREVPKPECVDRISRLIVLRGCLCLYSCNWNSPKGPGLTEVWMMMNYGVKDSWTKLFKINRGLGYVMKPVWFSRNGELLMGGNSKVVIYDPKHEKPKVLKESRSNARVQTLIYIASLVSLKSQKEIKK